MAWLWLFVAGLMEIAWAVGLKYSEGFRRPAATAATVVLLVLSFVFLSMAVRTLPIGTAYAIWTGIGAVGTAVLGTWLFGEPANAARAACIALVVAGIIGLKLTARG